MTSCARKSNLDSVSGDLQVQIPILSESEVHKEYVLRTVELKNVAQLKTMSGRYAQFYYSPGKGDRTITGESPLTRFMKTKANVFIPLDVLSQQMAVLYYHFQSLIGFNQNIGIAEEDLNSAVQVGLNVKMESENLSENNAFYDGETDSFLFVPYNEKNIPLAVNAGVIAHEYFHSIFYKKFLGQVKLTMKSEGLLAAYNETLFKGMNEGFADFWGWLYTTDENFIDFSISKTPTDRSLFLEKKEIGKIITEKEIEEQVQLALDYESVRRDLLSYYYVIGTPYARFLRQLVLIRAEVLQSQIQAKKEIAGLLIKYIENLLLKSKKINLNEEKIQTTDLFRFLSNQYLEAEDARVCEFISNYYKEKSSCFPQVKTEIEIQ